MSSYEGPVIRMPSDDRPRYARIFYGIYKGQAVWLEFQPGRKCQTKLYLQDGTVFSKIKDVDRSPDFEPNPLFAKMMQKVDDVGGARSRKRPGQRKVVALFFLAPFWLKADDDQCQDEDEDENGEEEDDDNDETEAETGDEAEDEDKNIFDVRKMLRETAEKHNFGHNSENYYRLVPEYRAIFLPHRPQPDGLPLRMSHRPQDVATATDSTKRPATTDNPQNRALEPPSDPSPVVNQSTLQDSQLKREPSQEEKQHQGISSVSGLPLPSPIVDDTASQALKRKRESSQGSEVVVVSATEIKVDPDLNQKAEGSKRVKKEQTTVADKLGAGISLILRAKQYLSMKGLSEAAQKAEAKRAINAGLEHLMEAERLQKDASRN